jgi:hypothetical protein
MKYPLCRHILTTGPRCCAPALTGQIYYYFHSRLHSSHSSFRHTENSRGYLAPGYHIQLSALEDREAVQVAISQVINALATGNLEIKRAMALLYGLQIASTKSVGLRSRPDPFGVVLIAEPTPDGLDLAEPELSIEMFSIDQNDEKPDGDKVVEDGLDGPLRRLNAIVDKHRNRR